MEKLTSTDQLTTAFTKFRKLEDRIFELNDSLQPVNLLPKKAEDFDAVLKIQELINQNKEHNREVNSKVADLDQQAGHLATQIAWSLPLGVWVKVTVEGEDWAIRADEKEEKGRPAQPKLTIGMWDEVE